MINGKKVLAIIPARGGSKGIPKKNLKLLKGKPLIAWTIDEAKQSQYIDKLIVSSDDDEIIKVSKEWGADVPFKRPPQLAQDDTPGIAPVLHAVEQFPDYDYVVLLQPTSPLRIVEDIDGAIALCEAREVNSCVSVTQSSTPPQWMYEIDENGFMKSILPQMNLPYQRQKAPTTYELNGAVYVATKKSLILKKAFLQEGTLPYIMPQNRSVDIDTYEDFIYCQVLLEHQ
ncbi:acylneuraminate cytidylyltransferase family protein [Robertmurraya andreesenii]|uniref:N-acylneuraminate cytidylyltransferase n=1 Tax=Anoxybacillus andreesenii TaxID=1325932 RepID=A0ABT9V7H4_9BACL|nr:acylneuraminate cytidylyltransferase family protein [Robertmurraya andreesenii]MDQ0156906.1 N-acylneuraminate cytidylyltransferase [Robertmurraya andreesenii]